MNNAIDEFFERISDAFQGIAKAFKTIWDNIKELLEMKKQKEDLKMKWHVPMKITAPDQVLNRKPLMAVARSRC